MVDDIAEDCVIDSEFEIENDDDNDDDDGGNDVVDDGDKTKLPPLITEFQEWLASPDACKNVEKTVKQHASQLYIMLKAIDDSEDVQSLLDLKLIRQVFLKSYVKEKKYEACTIKSYLVSLRHFYTFLLSDKPDGINFDWVDVSFSREKVKMWSASYKREASTRKWQKLEEDVLNRLTPSSIRKFEKSEAAREAVKTIGQHSDETKTTPVTQSLFTLVRDFLFTQIFIDNANRPGVLAHMTMDEFNKMRKHDGHYVIMVKQHKTAHIHGPARIVLSEKLKSWLDIFVHIMRAQVTSATSGPVFLSWNGNGMNSGHITKAVQSVFRKAGLDVKVTSTSFRKAAVTKVHIDQPDMSGKLADLMAHNQSTAKKYYLLSEKSKTSVEVSKNLGRLMRSDDGSKGLTNESPCKTNERTAVNEKVKLLDSETAKSESEESKRSLWSDDDLKIIKEIFKQEIIHDTITLDVVRYRVETQEELRGMSPRRIYDKLKKDAKRKSSKLVAATEPPQGLDSLQDKLDRLESVGDYTVETRSNDDQLSASIIAPSERNSSFTNVQVNTMHKLFKDMIYQSTTISRVEVEKRCSASRDGRSLLEKSSALALVNRIKYERRKHRLGISNYSKLSV